jgi:spore coat protein U-like protein
MAASVISLMKKEPGNIYLYPTDLDFGANYKYTINVTKNKTIEFTMTGGRSFEGTLEGFIEGFGTAEDKEKFLTNQ